MSLWPKSIFIYTDGACRGNPGPCAIGIEVFNEKRRLIHTESKFLDKRNTNNFAEYQAVIRALELCNRHQIKKLVLFSDSQLLVRQLNKQYKVKSKNIKALFEKCQTLLKNIPEFSFNHIPRENNTGADILANKALDRHS